MTVSEPGGKTACSPTASLAPPTPPARATTLVNTLSACWSIIYLGFFVSLVIQYSPSSLEVSIDLLYSQIEGDTLLLAEGVAGHALSAFFSLVADGEGLYVGLGALLVVV